MKTFNLIGSITLLAAAIMLTACEKEVQQTAADQNSGYSITRADVNYFGTPAIVDFMAGQNMLAGSVTVGNDAENLYVTYTTTNGWEIKAIHLYVGEPALVPMNKGGSTQPGQYPYKNSFSPNVTTHTYIIPLSKLPECVLVAAHAEVVKVENGRVVKSETAWGNGERFGKSWAMYFEYCRQNPPQDDPDPQYEYQYETAWANGARYTAQGNWATYTPYYGTETTVILYAGQHHEAGTVTFSAPVNGEVTITVNFADSWSLSNLGGTDLVKIQGYDAIPSKTPAPGQFNSYKGNELTFKVPVYAYYGIHLDVMKTIPVVVVI